MKLKNLWIKLIPFTLILLSVVVFGAKSTDLSSRRNKSHTNSKNSIRSSKKVTKLNKQMINEMDDEDKKENEKKKEQEEMKKKEEDKKKNKVNNKESKSNDINNNEIKNNDIKKEDKEIVLKNKDKAKEIINLSPLRKIKVNKENKEKSPTRRIQVNPNPTNKNEVDKNENKIETNKSPSRKNVSNSPSKKLDYQINKITENSFESYDSNYIKVLSNPNAAFDIGHNHNKSVILNSFDLKSIIMFVSSISYINTKIWNVFNNYFETIENKLGKEKSIFKKKHYTIL